METAPRTAVSWLALALGLFALVLSLVPFLGIFGVFPGIPAVGLGYAARARAPVQGGIGRGRGLAAMWLGGVATLLAVLQSAGLSG